MELFPPECTIRIPTMMHSLKALHLFCFPTSWIFLLLTWSRGTSEFLEGSADLFLNEKAEFDECPPGKYISSLRCLDCPAGHFCPGNVSAPNRCPRGTFNLQTGKHSIKDCKPCFPGLISSEDGVDCKLCPAGFSCDTASGALYLCPAGQYSSEGLLQCLPCPADSVCTTGFPHKCEPGTEPNTGNTECSECPPGFYSTPCTVWCLQCPAGSFCPDSGMFQPLPCPPGSSSALGQTDCHNCNNTSILCGGAMAPRWSHSVHRSVQSSTCRPGTYKQTKEDLSCITCPRGHYCVGGAAFPCPAGTYGPKEGLQRLRDCTMCPAGFYCLEGSSQRPTSQFMCPLGYYCEEGTATPHGSPCPAGTGGEQLGQTSRAACKRCGEGRFCPAGSAGPGLPCARGRFCPAGTLREVTCPPGTYTAHQGAISVKDCLKCPPGFFCPEDISDPIPCPPGSFNPLEGQDELADCRECIAGKACTQIALRAPDVDCMQGYVCPPGSSKPNAPLNGCPPGTFSNRTDLTDRSQCQQCPTRYACLRGTGGIQRPPLFCFSGHYCPSGTMFPTQYKCPAGTWNGQGGLEDESDCQPCPRGWYCLAGSSAPTGRCNSGHYCPEGTAYGTQFPCPAGTYSIQMGNRHVEDCSECPEGSFCEQGTSKPSPCPPSTFRPLKGGQKLEDCSPCPAGYFCPHSATVNPRVCGAGSYSDEGSEECLPCLQGHYCSDETTSEEAMLSVMVCPPGFLCSQGLARDPQRLATLCPRGFYCPGGGINPNPIPCPNGTYSDSPGLRDVAECVKCPEGKYCFSKHPYEQPITKPTGECPDGHYCPPGTGHPFTYQCQAGRYRNNTLGHRGEVCILCPSRYFCNNLGTSAPTICPQGFFCPNGTSTPIPCPEGTYSSRSALGNESECSPCGGGEYCAGVGLKEPSGSCKGRFYCRAGAKSSTPADGPTGGLCPPGSYCPPASASPLPCPPGTFSNSIGLGSPEECASCPPGFYCSGFNNTSPSGPCLSGFYCTGGSATPVQNEAEVGHYTLKGAARPEPCPPGTFQPRRGAGSCFECQGGRLCNKTGLSEPLLCPVGHYCPPDSSAAAPCPSGTYAEQPGGETVQHCQPCEAGSFCKKTGLSEPQGLCDPGHYCTSGAFTASPVGLASGGVCPVGYVCPKGTKHPHLYPCPVGTWSSSVGAQNLSFCHPCPPGLHCNSSGLSQPSGLCDGGYYCVEGAAFAKPSDGVTGNICPVEHYCPPGSDFPIECPDGTFSNATGAELCEDCPVGTYCLSGEGVQPCPAGHYCLGGGVEGILPCPPGTYNPRFGLSQVEQCLVCPAGFYCEDWGLFEPSGPCQAGYYCQAGVNFENPDSNFSTGIGGICPKGSYCPEGSSLPLACPPGTYSNSLYLTDASGCSPCPAGQYCGAPGLTGPSGLCQAGSYCPGGGTIRTGDLCPPSHYCPEGSGSPVPCSAGTYSNLTGQPVCSRCPAGYYCPEMTGNFTKFPCPHGFYCPDGTKHATQFPCPRGYYNPEPMTQSLDSCLPCPPGHYCEKERLTKVSGKCKPGWFCVSAAWNSQPFDLDNYTNANCLCPATSTGGRCQVGFYCPLGSSEPLPCPPGTFCNLSGLALPAGPCSPGYYCTGGATGARPTDGKTGNVCPPGTYCAEGSGKPLLCPPGTYSPVTALTNEAGCQPCTAGFYCQEAGLISPTGPCSQGYWCPPGQTVPTALPCPPGHFCTEGSSAPDPCPSGTYQNRGKQASCSVCEAGYYCDVRLGAANLSSLRPCPKGHYCPAGTALPTQHPCPIGSFNPSEHAHSQASCLPCATGHYCPSVGLSEPAGPCEAGYLCIVGASSPTPVDGVLGSVCPPGHYCPSGAVVPEVCPEGTWSNRSGLRSREECTVCLGGFYCDSAGLTKPSGLCNAGYYCMEGAVTSTPTDGVTGGPCTEGHYCPEGTVQPVPCNPGTYVTVAQATQCELCMPGWYCLSGSLYLCLAGFYCPPGTGFDLRSCPEGTYGPDPGYWSVDQCRKCDGGHYCSSRNATDVSGSCQEGYYCSHGNISPQPRSHDPGEGGPCPVGHYCPPATILPVPCPQGTFSNLSKLVSKEDCQPCPPGYYCDAKGLAAPSGKCWEGFLCFKGAIRPDPPIRDNRGGPCPKGYYCSEGSVAPQHCPLGTISTEDGRASCSACPQGFYCPGRSNDSLSVSFQCPVGHYCPPGTWSKHQYPCPAGSFNPSTQQTKLQDCLPCPPGSFCALPGKDAVSGPCNAGYFCLSGAQSPTPDWGKTGGRCPEGHYCVQGSQEPLPCPVGYYSNTTRNRQLSDCLPCPPGFLCVSRGLSLPSHICPAGSYCPGKENSSQQDALYCSPGNRCPPGSDRQIPCLPGMYQSYSAQTECLECPAGFFCPGSLDGDADASGTNIPKLCPEGHYCPPGTQTHVAFPCPAGSFSRQMGLSSMSDCQLCPPGTYCSSSGLAAPTGVCSPGYYCVSGSVSSQPEEGPTGGRCSSGFYCPKGTSFMIPCPPGTFGPADGAVSIEACLPCILGHYCAEAGLSSPSGLCSAAFYCREGSRTATPLANTTGDTTSGTHTDGDSSCGHFFGDVCPVGHYCPKGSAKPSPCPPGTFSGKSAAESEAECEACHPGSYCPSWAHISVDLLCPQGWFCPARSVSGYEAGHQCSPGHACPPGSAKPVVCFPGTFQSLPGQSTCDTCPRGFYCTEGSSVPAPCPVGHFSPLASRSSLSDCSPCPSGFFCNSSALTEPSGPCSPGHYCSLGSIEPCPVSQLYGDVCPMGHFCPQGSESPKPCPVGTFLPEPGAFSLSHCRPCLPGHYCLTPGASQPSGQCFKGFFCSGGADSPTPRANLSMVICLLKILELSSMKMEAAVWKHNLSNSGRNANWIKVEMVLQADSDRVVNDSAPHLKSPHYICSTYRGDICPQGFYCPMGSAYPQPCEAGFYCNYSGLEAPAGSCGAGYFCPSGSVDSNAHPCPVGHFCPLGTPLPLPCPLGTQKNYLGGSTIEACQPCPPGHYCNQRGIATPSGQCAAGYYCPAGQSSDRPQQHVCTVGHYCEKGSARQTPCSPGSCQPRQGQRSCETCPPGFVCQDQGMSLPRLCERGFYCPSGSAKQCPCPSGTYGNMSGLSEEAQCVLCDPGMYCKETGSMFPSGPCDAGFVCVRGASEASPSDSLRGFSCPLGYFCPVGTSVPKPCPKGTFSDQRGLVDDTECQSCSPGFYCSESGLSSVSGPCLPGFVCLEGSQSAAPLSGDSGGVCPVGHYCSEGTSVPSPCPPGFFRNEAGGKSKDDCTPCPLGWFQDLPGQKACNPCPPGFLCQVPSTSSTRGSPIGASSPLPCPAGFTCPNENPENQPIPCPKGTYSSTQGLISAGQCLVCPSGQFCGSEGMTEPSGQCAAGFLCVSGAKVPNPSDNITGSLCPPGGFCQGGLKKGDCWAGFYCDWGSSKADKTLCPAGSFCPNGTKNPIPCPAGTFSSEMGSTHQDNCKTCLPGYYCQDDGTSQPALCPLGHYCPAGLIYGVEFPCPPGTVQSQLGASNSEACLSCPAGMFCFQPGLSKPTGLCQAGYFCPAGSTSPNSTEYQGNTTRNHLCPPGHYCPSGTGYPLPCPPGSLSMSQGLKTLEECPPCPPGLFCGSPAMANLSDALPCQAGFVCLGGSSSPTLSDGSHGYPCPAGYSCPVGSTIEVPCEPGTYSPAPGAGNCMLCLKGSMCPSLGTQEPSTCPAGSFCPAGTALAQACPPGTFSNQTGAQSQSVCTPCLPGVYCSLYGATTPQGPCLEGYYCQGGATEPTPESSTDFPKNGRCPAGHYCPAGCLSPVPCPLGSVRNTSGGVSMEDCFTCPAGNYCSTEGLTSPSGPCAAGFYCPFDFSSTTPYAFICPKGHFCPEGSALAFPCPTGEYQPNPGSENCIPCRPGFYCEEAIVGEPRPCPPHSYCPAGTMEPQPCPNGTYTNSSHGGLQDESECLPCPPGRFCRAGKIQGFCAAGYLCLSGSADFRPQGPVSNLTECQWGVQCARPCPPGFFCPEGTQQAQLCPANTIRSSPGGVSPQDCLPCPPRYWCKPGDPVFHLCPAGHYCDGLPGSDFNGSSGPRPCPLYTYRVFPGAGSKGDCLPCPPGSHCNSTGFSNYSSTPCPPGFWCSGSGPPILCPAGTKRLLPGAAAPDHCEPCAGGTYCPDPRITGKPNIEGIPCRAAYQCPTGAALEKPCRAGSYCGPQTAEPQICPEGYICPEGSLSYNNPKQICAFPYYCPANSFYMRSCEGGSMPVNIIGLRGSKNSSCQLCDGGSYRIHLSPNLECLPCPPGYYCPAGTDSYKSTPCPLGFICPMGSTQPVPCPSGTFGNITHGEKTEDCHPCPANTFNHLPAQKACFPCGSSSISSAGSSSCTCRGKNRAFHYSDGSCLCRTGFIFYNELDFKSSVSDSELDCQPEVNRRCSTGEVRLAASRDCVSPSLHSCNVTCGKHGGTLDVEMGICRCEHYVSAEELCNTSCLSRLPQFSAQLSADGDILLSLKERDFMVWTKRIISVLGPDIRAKISGKTHLVQFDSDGVFGWIPSQKDLVSQFLSEPFETLNTRSRKRRYTDDDDGALTTLPRIPNPIACLSSGDMLIFHLTINHTDRHLSHFPVYQKDHLFNSNPNWDFGAFRHLQILMKQTNFNTSWFAHVFSEAGKYVFVDSAVPQRSMVVVVSDEGTDCDPRATAFQPMTPAHLVRHGVVKHHRLNLLPDWGLILAVLCLLLVVVVVLTITVLVLQPDKTKLVPQWKSKPKWRSLGEPFFPVECVCSKESTVTQSAPGILGSRGIGEGAEAEEPAVSKGGSVSGCCDLEEFNVKTLYDKLEDQNLHIASQLARHRKDMQEFYRNICEHTESLKNVFENMDSKKLSLLKEILVDKSKKDKASHSCVEDSGSQDGACVFLLGAVLKSVEALLFKLTGEAWQNQDLCGIQYGATTHPDTRDFEPQAGYTPLMENNIGFTQFSPMTKADAIPNDTDHMQTTAPCISDYDLSKLVNLSPLFKTLQEIQQSLQNLSTDETRQHCHKEMLHPVQVDHDGHLTPTSLEKLSPQHSAIFLFGCQVIQLLSNSPSFPSVLLLLAKSIPSSSSASNESLLAHCSEDYYFDAANQILYLSEAKLQHVGHFIAVILQSMAHIAAGSTPQRFMHALDEAISALSLQLFNLSFKWSAAEANLNASEGEHGTLAEQFFTVRVPSETLFTEHLLASRMEKYKYFKLEQLIHNSKQTFVPDTNTGFSPKGTPVQISCIEEEIDRISESFLQLSMQLQRRSQMSTWLTERENSVENHMRKSSASTPGLSRSGTILLELKRRLVSQRLNELKVTLDLMRRRQQHDSKLKDGAGGRTQSDSSITQQGESEQVSTSDGCNSTSDHQGYKTSAD